MTAENGLFQQLKRARKRRRAEGEGGGPAELAVGGVRSNIRETWVHDSRNAEARGLSWPLLTIRYLAAGRFTTLAAQP